ncbi:MAG: asparagine synthase (glutamine-hydrolyzing) [Deltaproteobacteria bacterium]|nr:asparagine synthase (glutamine-hydrolyzing) [Deltaproteobacteria bacterium]
MCGIIGILYSHPERRVETALLEKMNDTLTPRGPDDAGLWLEGNVGLALRRLAIIDVAGGRQPVANEDRTVIAINNGEIYNFKEIRQRLERKGHRFTSQTDTEILPHLYEEKGMDFVDDLNGMYALAIWDGRQKQLILARDRMGKKPLYYHSNDQGLWFASELKALLAHPEVPREIDPVSLQKYLAYEYIPAPRSIFKNIFKLPAGHWAVWKGGKLKIQRYWDIPWQGNGRSPSMREAQEELALRLRQAVRRRLISDVPLGAFLSGGIDSSTIVAMMAESVPAKQIKTFSIGFEEGSFDESGFAARVAGLFGVEHHAETFNAQKMPALLPEVIDFLDEPLGDASILPTALLSRFTRRHVTVALGGDGGDELFAGYQTFLASKWAGFYEKVPAWLRCHCIEPAIRQLPVGNRYFSLNFKLKQFLRGMRFPLPFRHIAWTGSFHPEELQELTGRQVSAETLYGEALHYGAGAPANLAGNPELYLYKKLYLQDDILTKVDRASMACSLEVRAPFLDREVVEFLSPLPYAWKLKGFTTKYLLKKMMRKHLPKNILHRKKQGFAVPVAEWIKKDLKQQFLESLHPSKIKKEGFFNAEAVVHLLNAHLQGRANHAKKLWTLFMFENWLERWGGKA